MMSYLNLELMNALCRFNRFDWRGDRPDRFFMMWPGMLIGLVVLVLVIVGIVFLVRALVRSGRSGNTPPAPPVPPVFPNDSKALQILDERLARGEISPEEYRQRKEELQKP